MFSTESVTLLNSYGIRPTSNRILVVRELLAAESPMSLAELECRLDSLEKSSVFRVLTLLLEHDVVHTLEDGRGITKYEICHGPDHCSPDDMHAHFYCEVCHRVYCFPNLPTPRVDVPEGFAVRTLNYMLKGICPECHPKS